MEDRIRQSKAVKLVKFRHLMKLSLCYLTGKNSVKSFTVFSSVILSLQLTRKLCQFNSVFNSIIDHDSR